MNLVKHRLSFEQGAAVLDDPDLDHLPDEIVDGERRLRVIGRIGWVTVVVVVHAHPEPDDEQLIRIISVREATRHERTRYENRTL